MAIRNLRHMIIRAALTVACLCFVGCGYFSYYAYYIPPDRTYKNQYERQESSWHRLSGAKGLFDVILVFQTPYVRYNRECFVASVRVAPPDDSMSKVMEERGWTDIEPVPDIDSVVIISQSAQERFILRRKPQLLRSWFDSESICLKRKHKRITIQFTASIKDETQQVLATDSFEIELERWEDRNWLGLE